MLVDIFKIMLRSDLNKFVAYSVCVCVYIYIYIYIYKTYYMYKATFLVMTHVIVSAIAMWFLL